MSFGLAVAKELAATARAALRALSASLNAPSYLSALLTYME
jgi:hypothetical protein